MKKKPQKGWKPIDKSVRLVRPAITMNDVVLPAQAYQRLTLILNQYRYRGILNAWGGGKQLCTAPMLILFSGPPGTGKTTAAEALAGELGRDLLVADFSQMDGKSGDTVKSIGQAIARARRSGKIMYWHEVDGFLCHCDDPGSWSARLRNAFLRELDGNREICIVSTDQQLAFDDHVASRITLKIDFTPPSADLFSALWKKLLPPDLPLADDVNFDCLSAQIRSVRAIKNIIANAGRNAVSRGTDAVVTMKDFLVASELEESKYNAHRIGFR